jgi:sulfite reductase alpha subunit-like flavoprotein
MHADVAQEIKKKKKKRFKIQILKHNKCNYGSNYKIKNKLIFGKRTENKNYIYKNKN